MSAPTAIAPRRRRRWRRRALLRNPRIARSVRIASTAMAVGGLAGVGLSLAVPLLAGNTLTVEMSPREAVVLPADGIFDDGRVLFVAQLPDGDPGCSVRAADGSPVDVFEELDAREVGARVVEDVALVPLVRVDGYSDGSSISCDPLALRQAEPAYLMPADRAPSKVPMASLSSGVAVLALGLLGLAVSAPPR